MDDKEATKMVISQAVRQSLGQTGHSTVDFQKHFNKKKTYWSEVRPSSRAMFETTQKHRAQQILVFELKTFIE